MIVQTWTAQTGLHALSFLLKQLLTPSATIFVSEPLCGNQHSEQQDVIAFHVFISTPSCHSSSSW